METGDAIISIRPEFANAILDNRKTVELRRRIPDMPEGTRLWIYATMPVGSIIGTATVESIFRGTPAAVWKKFKAQAGLSKESFFAYYANADEAVALMLADAQKCAPITIARLRGMRANFHPPQVIAKLTPSDASQLQLITETA